MHWTRTIGAVALTAAALAGCATTEPAAVLAGGPRMIDLYRGTAVEPWPGERGAAGAAARQAEPSPEARGAPEGTVPEAPKAAVVEATCRWWGLRWPCEAPPPPPAPACACGDAPGYTRTAANELELLFPRLPNPDIFIYVPAHLATELRIPVPGYTTAVPLYDRVEYAMPGEGTAARGPSEAPPGPSLEEARSDVSLEEVRPDANPEETPAGASTDEGRPGVSPEDAQPDASPEETRPGASPEEGPPDSSPEAARPGADPDVWPDASMEEAP